MSAARKASTLADPQWPPLPPMNAAKSSATIGGMFFGIWHLHTLAYA